MKRTAGLALCALLLSTTAFADAAVKTLAFHNIHIRVPEPPKAAEWYIK